jgi:hypothetical protein
MGVVEMRRVVAVVACVIGLMWVAPVTGAAPAPVQAAAASAAGGAATGAVTFGFSLAAT